MHRRDLLKFAYAAPFAMPAHWVGALPAPKTIAASSSRFLLIVELNGGNDGLNTVVPYTSDAYYAARPTLAIPRDQTLQLSDSLGFNPALAPLMPLWKDHQLAVLMGVGYPQPNRSHFRSIEIWDTGSDAGEYLQSGWLARAGLRAPRPYAADAVVIGRNPEPLSGEGMRTLVIDDIDTFDRRAQAVPQTPAGSANPALAHLLSVRDEVHDAGAKLLIASRNAEAPPGDFPPGPFGNSLRTAARLFAMGDAALVVKVALTGFDTHAGQRGAQDQKLKELATGLAAFSTSMRSAGLWDQTLVMSYSEFGRRVAENGSHGTDHGTAAPMFILGGKVHGGINGQMPSLVDLDDGDLRYAIDYRRVYNTVLKDWCGMKETPFKGAGQGALAGLLST